LISGELKVSRRGENNSVSAGGLCYNPLLKKDEFAGIRKDHIGALSRQKAAD